MKLVRLIRHAESAANVGLATTTPDSIPLTEKGRLQARVLADSITSAPDLIIASPFERAIATALPTAARFPHVPFEFWPVKEFTYLTPNRFAGTTQADRKPLEETTGRMVTRS
ncbi:phosphoglycerate mutase family protein [Pseudomonas fluorescens]|uniref:phosphoglycerate mutase family protein n=1 Tax=Pseudomonas fluorescens TaxID=294 RepID=UPI001CD4B945|nr:phosphoglycerate mutase family protein [Pseudomonas fluorescens]